MSLMTTHEVRTKAIRLLNLPRSSEERPRTTVRLRDGEEFVGVLMERAVIPDHFGMKERLGFTLDVESIRYCAIENIESF